jgi:hypothetical protein
VIERPLHHKDPSAREPVVFITLLVLCALIAAAPIWGPGIINTRGGGDSPFLLARTLDMAESLRHGILPVRWMAHAAYDLGFPFFNHYAALPFYLSGGLTAMGVDILMAIQITQTLGFLLAALAMNLWLRTLWPAKTARLLAVAAYTFAPFHMINVYVRGDSLSEFYAFAIYPLILWSLDRIAGAVSETTEAVGRRSRMRRVAGAITVAALAYGALALTHNVSFLIFSPFALLYGLSAIWQRTELRAQDALHPKRMAVGPALAALVAAFAGGILLTAWFWLPAIIETRYGQMGPAFTEGYFHFSNHFRSANLVQPTAAFNYSIATSVGHAGPFAMGLVQALLALAGAAVLTIRLIQARAQRDRLLPRLTLLVSLCAATLMITPLSRPLWEHLPLLATTQFPWRFLSVQALFAAAVTAALAEPGTHLNKTHGAWIATAATALLVSTALFALRPERLMIRAADVSRETLLLYESFTGNIGTTIRYEYLPRDVVPRLYISEAVIDGQGTPLAEEGRPLDAHLLIRTPVRQTWMITVPPTESDLATTPSAVAFPINAWPGWRAFIDGIQVPTYPTIGSGRLTLDLPGKIDQAATYTITFRLLATPLERWAVVISAGTLGVGLVALAVAYWRDPQGRHRRRPVGRTAPAHLTRTIGRAACISGILLLAVVGPLTSAIIRSPTDATARFFDFVQMPFPHQGPVDFGPARLLAAQLSGPVAQDSTAHQSGLAAYPGQTLNVSLDWDLLPTEALTATLRLVSPAMPRHGVNITLAETQTSMVPRTQLALLLPEDLARGLYFLQLHVTGAEGALVPRTPAGHGMGDLHIGALRIPEGPALPVDAPALAAFRDLTLHAVEAEQVQPDELRLKLAWSTLGTPRNWQLSIRLLDLEGHQIVARDHQPGYGYLPTTLWHPGEWITDYAVMPLPEGLAPGEYILRIVTYLPATMEGGGETDITLHLDKPTRYELRDACCEQTRKGATILCKTARIALLGLDLPASISEGEALSIRTEWNALSERSAETGMPGDLEATWRLAAPDGSTVSEITRPPAAGTKTTLWSRHTWVVSAFNLDLPAHLETGTYALELMLHEQGAAPVVCGRVGAVTIRSRPRSFTVPDLPYPQPANFGLSLQLLGYDVETSRRAGGLFTKVTADTLTLTFWWQALSVPEHDYKRFVHLYDPLTEEVVAQDDAMPRNWTYPTSLWTPQEVVSETVTLDLADIVPGQYRLAVGWYDPETLDRLAATAEPDANVRDNRLTLDITVSLP